MKKYLPLLLILSPLLIFSVSVYAADYPTPHALSPVEESLGTPPTNSTEIKQSENENSMSTKRFSREEARPRFKATLTERLASLHSGIETRRNEHKVRVSEALQIRIYASFDKAVDRFEKAVTHLSDLADRLEVRCEELEKRGFDMTLTLEEIDRARREISSSADSIAELSVSTHALLSSETPQEMAKEAKEKLLTVRAELKNARVALLSALTSARANVKVKEGTSNSELHENFETESELD